MREIRNFGLCEISGSDPLFALTQNLNFRSAKVRVSFISCLPNFALPTTARLSPKLSGAVLLRCRSLFGVARGSADGGSTASGGQNSSLLQPDENPPHIR
jgi:hypothetical protein